MKKLLLGAMGFPFVLANVSAQNLPTNPNPGKCYVKCFTKDVFEDITETVEIYPSYNTIEVVPATYKTIEERVLVKEASKRYTYVPAVYETVTVDYSSGGNAKKITVTRHIWIKNSILHSIS